ncbi:unnamed protein product, partial [Phaeothamnion confervicola]
TAEAAKAAEAADSAHTESAAATAALTEDEAEAPHLPHLVVVPSSVLSNWEAELRRFCPKLRVAVYHGSVANRARVREELLPIIKRRRGHDNGSGRGRGGGGGAEDSE